MKTDFVISSERTSPRLWLERLVIFRTLDPMDPIRDIPFQRGLNIIWGVAQEADDESEIPGVLTGHSVGKTTLCRLIRYALGEETFGRQSTVRAIQHAFPNGAIGATLYLENIKWSVIRPIGISGESLAAENTTIEELITQPPEFHAYPRFYERLAQAFIVPLQAKKPPKSENEYMWVHLLAWLSRDQEARYQNLWEWRSGRSDSKVPAFRERKKAALYLMRMVMDIIEGDEVAITSNLDTWNKTLGRLEMQMREMQQGPANQVKYHEQTLCSLLGADYRPDGDIQGIFGLRAQVSGYQSAIEKRIGELKEKRRSVNDNLSIIRADVRQHETLLEKIQAALEATQEGTEPPDEVDKELQNLETEIERECQYGQIPFRNCQHFNAYLKELRGELIDLQRARLDRRIDQSGQEKGAIIKEWLEEKTHLKKHLQDARKTIAELEKQYSEYEQQIIELSTRHNRLLHHAEQWQEAQDLRDGKKTDTKLEQIRKQVETLRGDIRDSEKSLKSLQSRQYVLGEELRKLYDKVLKTVLSDSYTGAVLMPPRYDFDFRIQETAAGLAGEAVETLSLVLADFTAALWAVQGNGGHPAFLLHDSPREADLDRHIYNRFLRSIHQLSISMGGDAAPFQYIITTTSKPPKTVLESDTVRLKLQAHPENDLLFKQFLNVGPLLF